MKILYLSTVRHPNDYETLLSKTKRAPNPSNQNFHTKLIELLTRRFDVRVFSTRPMEKSKILKEGRNEKYYYPFYFNIPIFKSILLSFFATKEFRQFKPDIIFVDVMNVTLLRLAKTLKAKFMVPVIGLLTDNPINITGARKNYNEEVFKLAACADGYIALTEGLVRLYNTKSQPSLVIPGFLSDSIPEIVEHEEYAYFGGALYPRYGVDKLIDVFRKNNIPLKLLIAGHGPLVEKLSTLNDENIVFLGQITPDESMKLAARAKININPRPIDAQIDLFSVPSKVLDFIHSGTITLSTTNQEIFNLVGDSIYWIHDNEVLTIKNALIDILNNYEYWQKKAKEARTLLVDKLDFNNQTKEIEELIRKLAK